MGMYGKWLIILIATVMSALSGCEERQPTEAELAAEHRLENCRAEFGVGLPAKGMMTCRNMNGFIEDGYGPISLKAGEISGTILAGRRRLSMIMKVPPGFTRDGSHPFICEQNGSLVVCRPDPYR
jgi:hypothetical protein